jgi:hypothetical protein
MPTILDLPLETLWMVAENLEFASDLNILARTRRPFSPS